MGREGDGEEAEGLGAMFNREFAEAGLFLWDKTVKTNCFAHISNRYVEKKMGRLGFE